PSGHYLHCLTRPFVALAALLTSFSPSSSFSAPPAPALYSLSLHDALPIYAAPGRPARRRGARRAAQLPDPVRLGRRPTAAARRRSEEHTSELQSRFELVCRLLLEKRNVCWIRAAPDRKSRHLISSDVPVSY